MRLAYIVDEYPTLTQTFVMREIEAMADRGHEILVIPLRVGEQSGTELSGGVEVVRPASRLELATGGLTLIGGRRPRHFWWEAGRMVPRQPRHAARHTYAAIQAARVERTLRKFRPDLIHAHFARRTADVARFLSIRTGVPYSVTVHAADIYSPDSAMLLRRRLENAIGIVAISSHASRTVESLIRGARMEIIHCGVSLADVQRKGTAAGVRGVEQFPRVLSVGRLVPKKGFSVAVTAAASLSDLLGPASWWIIGDGPERSVLECEVAALGPNSPIVLKGAADNSCILRLMAQAELFVLPSMHAASGDSDGIPVVLMETMALARPAVSTPVGGIGELIQDGVTGWLVPPDDSDSLALAVRRALEDQAELSAVGQRAAHYVSTQFDVDRSAGMLEKAMERWLSGGP